MLEQIAFNILMVLAGALGLLFTIVGTFRQRKPRSIVNRDEYYQLERQFMFGAVPVKTKKRNRWIVNKMILEKVLGWILVILVLAVVVGIMASCSPKMTCPTYDGAYGHRPYYENR